MALINCSECSTQISDKAAACPQCGNPCLTSPSDEPTLTDEVEDNETYDDSESLVKEQKKKTSNIVFAVGLMAFALILSSLAQKIGGSSSSNQGDNPSSVELETAGSSISAWSYIQMSVTERLKSPSSAAFPFGGHRDVQSIGDGRFEVSSYVDSQNSFGAQIRTNFTCTVIHSGTGSGYNSWSLESLQID